MNGFEIWTITKWQRQKRRQYLQLTLTSKVAYELEIYISRARDVANHAVTHESNGDGHSAEKLREKWFGFSNFFNFYIVKQVKENLWQTLPKMTFSDRITRSRKLPALRCNEVQTASSENYTLRAQLKNLGI